MREKIEYDPIQEEVIIRNMRIAHADSAVIVNPYAQNRLHGHSSWMAYFKPDMSPDVYRNHSCGGLMYHLKWDWLIPAAKRITKKYMTPLHSVAASCAMMDFEDAVIDDDITKAVKALDKIIKEMVPDYFRDEHLIL